MSIFDKYAEALDATETISFMGRVERVTGMLIESYGPSAVVGEICQVEIPKENRTVLGEVVGLNGQKVQLMLYGELDGVEVGSPVTATGNPLRAPVSPGLLGRVIDGLGRPLDGRGEVTTSAFYPVHRSAPPVLERKPIREQIRTGVRAIDAFTPVGKGQRMGIFSGSGVGKSTLLGMIARSSAADVNVIALIGERGREVQEFLENDLGPEGLAKSVVVVSSSDTSALARLNGAYMATAVAEYFRDQGKDVVLMFDSVTRFARAQREIGLSAGEAPATRGYPPSVFAVLPKLLERCGNSENGTITGFYTVLVDGDDMDEPIADTVRGILDGHLVLSRKLAEKAHFPAIDVLASISRLTQRITGDEHQAAARLVRRYLADYTSHEDLINIGAYQQGSNPDLDMAIRKYPAITRFLTQGIREQSDLPHMLEELGKLAGAGSQESASPKRRSVAPAWPSGLVHRNDGRGVGE